MIADPLFVKLTAYLDEREYLASIPAAAPIAEAEYRELVSAMEHTPPACLGDARFTAETLGPRERAELTWTCTACPLAPVCLAYARTARPPAGFWAGRTWTITNQLKKEKTR